MSGNAGEILPEPLEDKVVVVDPIDQYTALAVRGVIIGTGLLGAALFLRNSRLFAKFTHASQIPREYIKKEILMKGHVNDIISNEGILKIEHESMVKLPRLLTFKKQQSGFIDVRLAGLDVSPAGLEYLANDVKLKGKRVNFTVIKRSDEDQNSIDAEVTAKSGYLTQTNLNVDLVRRGYARVHTLDNRFHYNSLQTVPSYSRLVSKLLMSEKIANLRGVGIWQRDTWVESVAAYPSQFLSVIKSAAITRFVVLLFLIAKDIVQSGTYMAKSVVEASKVFYYHMSYYYRRFALAIERVSRFYQEKREKFIKK